MKASEAIERLQSLIAENGDLPLSFVGEFDDATEAQCIDFLPGDEACFVVDANETGLYVGGVIRAREQKAQHVAQQELVFAQMRAEGRLA
jgi:hypothetical protein